MNSSEWMNSSE